MWFGRPVAVEGFLSGIVLCRSPHCWRFVWLGFLASCPVCFCRAVVGLVFVVRFQPVRFGLLAVTIKLSGLVLVLWRLACGAAFRFLWRAAWVFWFMANGFGRFGLVPVGCFRSGGVAVSVLRGSAVWRVFPVRTKRHPHAQQASQRDCPPFRLAKLVFYQR